MLEIIEKLNPYSSVSDEITPLIPNITKGANVKAALKKTPDGMAVVEGTSILDPTQKHRMRWDMAEEIHYDFREFTQAEDVDGYIATTFRLTVEQMLKNGFGFQGPDSELVDQVEMKVKQIMHASRTHMEEFLENMSTGLTKYCNSMAVFVRKEPVPGSPFRQYMHRGKLLNPIAGIFYAEPQHMSPKRKNGQVKQWEYLNYDTGANKKTFPIHNVFHSRWNRKGDHVFGTPWVLPALDDVRMLRRLEEFVQMLISKHLFPLYQYKIGTKEHPAMLGEQGSSEVKTVRAEIGALPTQGCVFTSHRHEIVAIQQNASVLDIKDYVEHFDRRALSSCGLSDIDVGRGNTSNKGTASVMNQTRVDRCTRIQNILQADFREQIIIPILLSLGRDPFMAENEVTLEFNEIDTEEKRNRELHDIQKFQNGLMTHDEARSSMRVRPFRDQTEWDNTYQNTVQRIGAEQGNQESNETTKQKALVSNKTAPANQAGKKAKPKVAKND